MGRFKTMCKMCRREGVKLFLKGDRCASPKCSVERRNYPPGAHARVTGGQFRQSRLTEYGRRLREKQKARRVYGLTERQFRNYFEKASAMVGVTGQRLLQLLEMRLDNVAYRLGYALTRPQARQLVRHGHIRVNNRKVSIPSYQVKVGSVIEIKEEALNKLREKLGQYKPPAWLELAENLSGRVLNVPSKDDTERLIEESLIVEYYSR